VDARENLAKLERQLRADGRECGVAKNLAGDRFTLNMGRDKASPEAVLRQQHMLKLWNGHAGTADSVDHRSLNLQPRGSLMLIVGPRRAAQNQAPPAMWQ
jgi:hypothetical protein